MRMSWELFIVEFISPERETGLPLRTALRQQYPLIAGTENASNSVSTKVHRFVADFRPLTFIVLYSFCPASSPRMRVANSVSTNPGLIDCNGSTMSIGMRDDERHARSLRRSISGVSTQPGVHPSVYLSGILDTLCCNLHKVSKKLCRAVQIWNWTVCEEGSLLVKHLLSRGCWISSVSVRFGDPRESRAQQTWSPIARQCRGPTDDAQTCC